MIKQIILICSIVLCCSFCGKSQVLIKKKTSKHLTQLQLGYMVGVSGDIYFFGYNSSPILNIAHGYQIDNRVAILGGLGLENHKDGTLMPLMLNLALTPTRKTQQKIQIQLGYSVGFRNTTHENYHYDGGFLGGLNYGFYIFKTEKIATFFTIGYEFRRTHLKYSLSSNDITIKKELDNHFFALKTGIEF